MKKPIRALRNLERNSTEDAVRRLMDGDLHGSIQSYERAELAKGLIDHIQGHSYAQVIVPIAVALLCGILATVLAVYRVPSVSLVAKVRCTSTSFTPADAIEWKGNALFRSELFRFEKFSATMAPLEPSEKPGPDSGKGAIRLKGRRGHASLKSVSFDAGSKISLEVDKSGQLQMFARNGVADAQVVFWGKVQVELESDGDFQAEPMDVDIPETLYLARTDRGIVSSLLQFDPKDTFELPLVEVDAVSFSKEIIDDGVATFEPSIIEADLSILDTDDQATVGPNQSLTLINFRGQIRRIQVGEDIQLGLTGTADDVVITSGDIERSLVPSYLAFMYQNQQIALVWSGVAFLWGMLWSVGRFVTRRS